MRRVVRPVARPASDRVLLYTPGPGKGWWRARYAGYTSVRAEAHPYTARDADMIVKRAYSPTLIHPLVPLPLFDAPGGAQCDA